MVLLQCFHDLPDKAPIQLETHGKSQSVEEDYYPVRSLQSLLKDASEASERAVINQDLVTNSELIVECDVTAFIHSPPDRGDQLVLDCHGAVAEIYQAGNAPCEPDLMEELFEFEPGEEIAREQGLDHFNWLARVLTVMNFHDVWAECFNVPGFQIRGSAVFLSWIGMNNVPTRT